MVKTSGGLKHSKALAALRDQGKDFSKELFVAGDIIRAEAVLSITQGSVSGAGHVPSAPGEAPNRDTGVLDSSISVRRVDRNLYEVVADAPYAVAQEYGTVDGRLPERPYMRPAAVKHGPKASKLITVAIQRRNKGV